jgi:NTP pyrophosphatase (non-canonical NTP hydrolase)|tara:strand:- start:13465 stop:13791 length:327 start_codon:yes stop_codon:yes gene_type:complete
MDFTTYQQKSRETAIYKSELKLLYPALGLAGEAGEVCEKIKKIYRDKDGEMSSNDRLDIRKELGDVLWYISQIACDIDVTLASVATANLEKLRVRKENGTLGGSGDDR